MQTNGKYNPKTQETLEPWRVPCLAEYSTLKLRASDYQQQNTTMSQNISKWTVKQQKKIN